MKKPQKGNQNAKQQRSEHTEQYSSQTHKCYLIKLFLSKIGNHDPNHGKRRGKDDRIINQKIQAFADEYETNGQGQFLNRLLDHQCKDR